MSVTRRRDLAGRRLRALAGAALVAVVALTTLTSCRADDDAGRVVEIVVPDGTQARLDRGEDVVVMPAELRFEVGDTLLIRNEDVADQSVGPYEVRAGQEFRLRYGAPGRFEGMCPLSEDDTYVIVVTE